MYKRHLCRSKRSSMKVESSSKSNPVLAIAKREKVVWRKTLRQVTLLIPRLPAALTTTSPQKQRDREYQSTRCQLIEVRQAGLRFGALRQMTFGVRTKDALKSKSRRARSRQGARPHTEQDGRQPKPLWRHRRLRYPRDAAVHCCSISCSCLLWIFCLGVDSIPTTSMRPHTHPTLHGAKSERIRTAQRPRG